MGYGVSVVSIAFEWDWTIKVGEGGIDRGIHYNEFHLHMKKSLLGSPKRGQCYVLVAYPHKQSFLDANLVRLRFYYVLFRRPDAIRDENMQIQGPVFGPLHSDI